MVTDATASMIMSFGGVLIVVCGVQELVRKLRRETFKAMLHFTPHSTKDKRHLTGPDECNGIASFDVLSTQAQVPLLVTNRSRPRHFASISDPIRLVTSKRGPRCSFGDFCGQKSLLSTFNIVACTVLRASLC